MTFSDCINEIEHENFMFTDGSVALPAIEWVDIYDDDCDDYEVINNTIMRNGEIILSISERDILPKAQDEFIDGFVSVIKEIKKFSIDSDMNADYPWCMPWVSQPSDEWYDESLEPYEMGVSYAKKNYDYILELCNNNY